MIADRNDHARGTIKGQPRQFVFGHQNRRLDPMYETRDCGYETPCWVWRWSFATSGYGQIREAGRMQRAHRVIYERHRGPVPKGLELDHLCRNQKCVRPDHLEPVTHAENMRRGANVRVTREMLDYIRSSPKSAGILAVKFGLSRAAVHALRAGRTWRDVA